MPQCAPRLDTKLLQGNKQMRMLVAVIVATVGVDPALSGTPEDLITAPNAILCLSRDSLDAANEPAVSKSQAALRAMGCLRSESGIRTRLMDSPEERGPWRVRFYPAGMSGGVVLWGLPSSFTAPNGAKIATAKR
jgi:hypothetical protein